MVVFLHMFVSAPGQAAELERLSSRVVVAAQVPSAASEGRLVYEGPKLNSVGVAGSRVWLQTGDRLLLFDPDVAEPLAEVEARGGAEHLVGLGQLLIHASADRDLLYDLATGERLDILATVPDGTLTSGYTVIGGPWSSDLWLLVPRQPAPWLGRWEPGAADVVKVKGETPFQPVSTGFDPVNGDAFVTGEARDGDTVGCSWYWLPRSGKPSCPLENYRASVDEVRMIGQGWVAIDGTGRLEVVPLKKAKKGGPLFDGECTPALHRVSVDPPRILASCRGESPGDVLLRVWAPDGQSWDLSAPKPWSNLLPEGPDGEIGQQVVGVGFVDEPRNDWINLESGKLIETPPLRTPGVPGMLPRQFLAIGTDNTVLSVDGSTGGAKSYGVLSPCDGELQGATFPDGSMAYACVLDGETRWSVAMAKERLVETPHVVSGLLADGRLITMETRGETVRVHIVE